MNSLDWVIVGGGIHGVHIAACLLEDAGVDPERLRLVDPGPRLLSYWKACAKATGMTHMRSGAMQHIDTESCSLVEFASERYERTPGLFAPPNDRPCLELFEDHCNHVITRFALDQKHIRDRVVGIEVDRGAAKLRLANGESIRAQRVVLAIGSGQRAAWPAWAPQGDERVQHINEPGLGAGLPESQTVGVVGGGISAAQISLRLARSGQRVELISRHALRTRQYDSAPGWHGPLYMRGFEQVTDLAVRRAKITAGRNRGSIPSDVRKDLQYAINLGAVAHHISSVERVDTLGERLGVELENGTRVEVDDLLLATGFAGARPGGPMLDQLASQASLSCAPCGYPIVDSALRWHPLIYVTGALAELELGPMSRTIAGARRAGERILASLRSPSPVAAV